MHALDNVSAERVQLHTVTRRGAVRAQPRHLEIIITRLGPVATKDLVLLNSLEIISTAISWEECYS